MKGEGQYIPDLYGGVPPTKLAKFKVNVWGCISWHGQGTPRVIEGRVNAQTYIGILDECLWSVVAKHFPRGNFLFQEDNAPIHKARVVKSYMENHEISPIPWPAYSPDLNPIENCWSVLKAQLQKEIHLVTSNKDLSQQVQRIWSGLPVGYFKGLYNSMPARCRAVQILKGHLTKY